MMAFGALAGLPPLLVAMSAGAGMVSLAAVVIVPNLWMFFWALMVVHWVLPDRWISILSPVLPDALILGTIAIFAVSFFTLRAIARGLSQRACAAPMVLGKGDIRFTGRGTSSNARALLRDCANGRRSALLMHACGPALLGPSLRGFGVALGAGLALVYGLPGWIAEYKLLLRLIVPGVILISQMMIASAMVGALYAARGEQALARLAQRLAGATSLNATLVRALLLEYTRWWGALTLLALVSSYALGTGPNRLLGIFVICLLVLSQAGMVLRDYAAAPDRMRSWRWVEVPLLLVLLILAGACASGKVPTHVWLPIGAAVATATFVFGRVRWHAMLRAPVAFPAGRGS